MIHFRLRDLLSVLFYRLLAPFFGSFGRRVRLVQPLRIWGARYIHLADDVTIATGTYIAVLPQAGNIPEFRIGRGTQIGNHSHVVVTSRVAIGERVLIADRVFISDNGHEYRDIAVPVTDQGLHQLGEVAIGDGSWIGENACIVGCRIGRHCVVAANAVVTRDVPDHCVVAGAPARIVRRWDAGPRQWMSVAATAGDDNDRGR